MLTENLKTSLFTIMDDDVILNSDFEALISGMLMIKETLHENTEASKKIKERWKNEGKHYFQKNKKDKAFEN